MQRGADLHISGYTPSRELAQGANVSLHNHIRNDQQGNVEIMSASHSTAIKNNEF